ncbi:MAG: hypothetical protein AAF436_09545 [Myxococcota bacterium]
MPAYVTGMLTRRSLHLVLGIAVFAFALEPHDHTHGPMRREVESGRVEMRIPADEGRASGLAVMRSTARFGGEA